MNSFSVVLVAAGSSRRMGRDKLTEDLQGATVAERSLSAFFSAPEINQIIVVTDNEELKSLLSQRSGGENARLEFVSGGKTRAKSVKNGIEKVQNRYVLVHDAARPFVSEALIRRIITDTVTYGSAVPCLPMYDSIRVSADGRIVKPLEREEFVRVQTPQGYVTEELLAAYAKDADDTDESGIYLTAGKMPHCTEGEENNIKITRPADVFGLGAKVGTGYDVHKLAEGRKLILGGVEIPSDKGEEAHSDGDVLLHAVMDAMLSAAGERDIGNLFPDKDPAYKDISSMVLLKKVAERIKRKGFVATGISAVIALQAPKLAPYIPQMINKIKKATECPFVNVSATTTEHLGIVGDGGIAVTAVATLF